MKATVREGSQFGRYYLRRLLGRGGMGDVYKAENTSNQRIVALKVWPSVFSHDLVFCARLQRQARIVGQLDEPHIVPIHDYGEIDGRQFLDMQLIEGINLSKLLKRQETLTAPRAVAIVRQIASALDAAHAVGIRHGDVKPENILIAQDDVSYLVDFGISDAAPFRGVARVIGSTARTWKYTAPERFTAPAVDHRVDVYALACVLHECLTGSPPYSTDNVGALISAHLTDPIPRPSQLQPAVPDGLDEVIACGMAKDPAGRYASAGDLALAAHEALNAQHERTTDICEPSHDATRLDAAFEASPPPATRPASAVPMLHPPAHRAYRQPSVSESLSEPSWVRQYPQTPQPVPRFGLDSSQRPGEFDKQPTRQVPSTAPGKTAGRRRPALVIVALIILSGVAIWLLRPSYSPPATVPSTNSTRSTALAPTFSADEVQARLLSLLPRDYSPGTCKPITPPMDALSEVSCEKNSDPDGPMSATYLLFADATSLRGAFDRIVQSSNIIECPGRIQSPGPWHRNATPDKASGMLLCGTQDGNLLLGWTNDAEQLISVAKAGPQGPTIDQLYAWWTSHS